MLLGAELEACGRSDAGLVACLVLCAWGCLSGSTSWSVMQVVFRLVDIRGMMLCARHSLCRAPLSRRPVAFFVFCEVELALFS